MELVKVYGQICYPKGYTLYVRDKQKNETIELVAVPAIRDGDFCRGCYFERACHAYPGLSPIGALCMTTIFVDKALSKLFLK